MKARRKIEQQFNEALRNRLTARFGASRNEGYLSNMYELRLETKAGTLLVQPSGSWVAMRFVEVERAKEILPHRREGPLNPFSGKYNSLFLDEVEDIEARVDIVQNMIERVT